MTHHHHHPHDHTPDSPDEGGEAEAELTVTVRLVDGKPEISLESSGGIASPAVMGFLFGYLQGAVYAAGKQTQDQLQSLQCDWAQQFASGEFEGIERGNEAARHSDRFAMRVVDRRAKNA